MWHRSLHWNHRSVIRFIIHVAISIVSSALALIVCAWLVDGFEFSWEGFLVAVLVFTIAQAILAPFVFNMARKYAPGLLGAIGIVSTFVSLLVASFFPGGLQISGVTTWILAALIVWAVTALGAWLFPLLFLKKKVAASQPTSPSGGV